MNAPQTGRACVLAGKNNFALQEYPLPEPAPGTVLIEMELCGMCGTDAHYARTDLPPERYPYLLGHENVGRIAALGPGLEQDFLGQPVRVGDRIVPTGGAPAGLPCGRCYFCAVVKTPTRCTGGRPVPPADRPPHFTGGYAEYLYLAIPGSSFFKVDLTAERAVLLEPLATAVHAIDRSGLRLGDTAVIQGSGAIGLLTLICARLGGAVRTIVVGGPRGRLELAQALGADVVIDIAELTDQQERIRTVRAETPLGLGAAVVFECAGVPGAINEGLAVLRDSGTLVEVGHFVDAGQHVTINPAADLVRRNISIVAPFASTVEHFARALPVLARPDIPFERLLTHRLPLSRTADGIAALSNQYQLDHREVVKVVLAPGE